MPRHSEMQGRPGLGGRLAPSLRGTQHYRPFQPLGYSLCSDKTADVGRAYSELQSL